MDLSTKKYKVELLEGGFIEFNLLSAQAADNIYAAIQQFDDQPEYIEFLFNKLTDNKYDINTLHAGIPSLVIYSCIIKSGIIKSPTSLIDIIESGRTALADNVYFSIYSSISQVLPLYKLDELKQKTVNELFELFVYAEKVSGKQLFDTDKMRKSLEENPTDRTGVVKKKGLASVSKDEIEMLQQYLATEERYAGGMPMVGAI